MGKQIELQVGDVVAVARLLEDEAPQTVQRLWEVLPIEEKMRHVRWGGNAGYVLCAALRDPNFPLENRVSFYTPATIALKPQHGELAFSYGQAQARDPRGNGWATSFAVLESGIEPFLDAVKRTQSEGVKQLTIRRKES